MPQLKKLSVSASHILPKINQQIGYNSESMYSPYITLVMEDDRSQLLTSEPESDVSDSVQNRPRKRQRLDHLSQEEKVMRRKLKNRVAAQTARDRKKAKMQELEEQVSRLVTEKRMLLLKSVENIKKINALEQENTELKIRLGLVNPASDSQKVIENNVNSEQPSSVSEDSRSLEHAEGTGSEDSFTVDDAVRLLASNSETNDILDLLQQFSEDFMECNFTNIDTDCSETREDSTITSEMVGSPSKGLESNKELIHFDHIYSKQDDIVSVTDDSLCLSSLPESDLSTKDSILSPQTLLPDENLDGIVEIVESSTDDIPIISIPSNPSESQLDELSFQCESFPFGELNEHLLCPPPSSDHCSSPAASSDTGYDSSFSAPSPCGEVNPWDDTLTELFPTLV